MSWNQAHAPHPSSLRAFQRHQEHDLKHPSSMNLITTQNKTNYLPSYILYINPVSLSICPGWYILNLCEHGVVFVFNVPSWTCLSICLWGQKLGNAWKILPITARSLWNIWSWFLFFSWRGGGGGGGVLGVLIGGSEKEHIVIRDL